MTIHPRHPAARTAAVCAVVLAAAACTGPAPEPATTTDPTAGGPLEIILSSGQVDLAGDSATTRETVLAQTRQREETIASCMHDLGFEYAPQVPKLEDIKIQQGLDRASREYAEQYGYGIWAPPAEESGGIEWSIGADPEHFAYLEAMSETTRAAYDEALYGPVLEVFPDDSVSREGGCADQASLFGADADVADAVQDAWDHLAALDENPRFADLDRRWSRCLADAGFDATSPASARADTLEALTTALDATQTMPKDTDERAADERALALADWDCQDSIGYVAAHRTIAHELQQEYVDDHRTELDGWLALAGTSGTPEGEQ